MVPDSRMESNKDMEVPTISSAKDEIGKTQMLVRSSHHLFSLISSGIQQAGASEASVYFLFIKLWDLSLPGLILFVNFLEDNLYFRTDNCILWGCSGASL